MGEYQPNLQSWFDYILKDKTPERLSELLHDDVVFKSPVVHTPQKGKAITMAYLTAAGGTLGGDKGTKTSDADSKFKYTRIFDCGDKAVNGRHPRQRHRHD